MSGSMLRRALALGLSLSACGGTNARPAAPPPASVAPPGPLVVPASAGELHFEGRFEEDAGVARFEWPGSAVWLRFAGTGAQVTLGEKSLETDDYGQVAHDWYDVTVDGALQPPLVAIEGVHTYVLAAGLANGEHTIVLRRRTEAYVGEGEIESFTLDAGGKLLSVTPPARRLEFVGDSITAGFGVDGADALCLFSSQTENYSHSYAALTAQALGADQVAIAATGEGVLRNWGGTTLNTIGDLYPRILPTHADSRFTGQWTPDVVVMNLGTNDFSTGDPGSAAFVGAYQALVAQVRRSHPSALIVIALGPMLSDWWPAGAQALTNARADLTQLVTGLNAAGDARVKLFEFDNQDSAASFGCRYHPSAQTHRQMADKLTAFLRAQLGW